jgi:hypothetical protein
MVNENESTIADETGPSGTKSPVRSPVEVPVLSAPISQHVRDAAWEAAKSMLSQMQACSCDECLETATLSHAFVILAERKRCADLVRGYPEVIPMWSRGSAPPGNGPPRRATQAELAAAIRKGEA